MSAREVMAAYMLLGLGLGVLGGINLMVANDGNFRVGLLGIAIGLSVGFAGDIIRVIYLRYSSPSTTSAPLPKDVPAQAQRIVVIALAVVSGLVRAAGGPPLIYLPLLGGSLVLLTFVLVRGRNR